MLILSEKVAALRRTVLFGELDPSDCEALAARAVEYQLNRGETLFLAGEPAAGLYVIVEGSVRAYRVNADGREQVIHVERAGATLAEVPVFDGGPYPSSTAAEESCTLLFIRRDDVLRLCLERPRISLAALRLLASRMRNCAALIERLSLRDVDRRLAQLLLDEASDYGRRSGDQIEFQLALTHQQIAARVGSVREVVSRSIARLQQGGLIKVDGRKVIIPSEEALRSYASE
jgi:cAMP-binding proteins - catabolite gene activator and regulatory subunit of cAMP-dependent protein kinases